MSTNTSDPSIIDITGTPPERIPSLTEEQQIQGRVYRSGQTSNVIAYQVRPVGSIPVFAVPANLFKDMGSWPGFPTVDYIRGEIENEPIPEGQARRILFEVHATNPDSECCMAIVAHHNGSYYVGGPGYDGADYTFLTAVNTGGVKDINAQYGLHERIYRRTSIQDASQIAWDLICAYYGRPRSHPDYSVEPYHSVPTTDYVATALREPILEGECKTITFALQSDQPAMTIAIVMLFEGWYYVCGPEFDMLGGQLQRVVTEGGVDTYNENKTSGLRICKRPTQMSAIGAAMRLVSQFFEPSDRDKMPMADANQGLRNLHAAQN